MPVVAAGAASAMAGTGRTLSGVSHWLDPLRKALQPLCPQLRVPPGRPVIAESLCSGTGAEFIGYELLGLK
eukprot:221235-Lingulodinium_polyedra.AAC.1